MTFQRFRHSASLLAAFGLSISGNFILGQPANPIPPLPVDFIDQSVAADGSMRLTLPNGRVVVGKAREIRRTDNGIAAVTGTVDHPEPGDFTFTRTTEGSAGQLSGWLGFTSQNTRWTILKCETGDGFRLAEVPAEDAFRPRNMRLPDTVVRTAAQGLSREEAEAGLRRGLNIEKIGPGKLRIGLVSLDQLSRSIRFPATANMNDGTVEYAVVTSTGKVHEALFSTQATPRDIHLAMLLLGTQPATCVENADKSLQIPPDSAVRVHVEWPEGDQTISRTIASLVSFSSDDSKDPNADRVWLYNGSRFNQAGFGAQLDGSIVSLIADDMALVNNASPDRANDEIHRPRSALMPRNGNAVTVVLSRVADLPSPSSSPNP